MIGSMLWKRAVTSRVIVARRASSTLLSMAPRLSSAQTETIKTPTTTTRALFSTKASLSGGQQLEALSSDFPHKDVVRYEHKNRTWTLQHVHYYSEALAIGLMENGFQAGDVVLSLLPPHLSEQMVLQFACSKSGLILYSLDPTTVSDPATALSAALKASNANILISMEAGNDVNYISVVQQVVPELRVFDVSKGMPFVSPRFPHLRMCIHTGFDQDDKAGWFPLRHMVVPSDNLDNYTQPVTGKTPLAGQFQVDGNGIPTGVGATLDNEQVLKQNVWPTYSAILKKEFHDVEGVGVIF